MNFHRLSIGLIALCLISAPGCASSGSKEEPVEFYPVSYRQLPPDKVYSRVTWAHLPQPIPKRASNNAPLILPNIAFELADSSLQEAVEALAQTIGYSWNYPQSLAHEPVSIRMDAPVDEILNEIGRQVGAKAELDHERRVVRIQSHRTLPRLSQEEQRDAPSLRFRAVGDEVTQLP